MTGSGAPPPRPALLTYLMLNGGSPPGLEILALTALFCLPGHFEQHPGLLFRVSGIEDGAAGDQ